MKVLLFLLTSLSLVADEHAELLALAKKWEVPQPHPKSSLVRFRGYQSKVAGKWVQHYVLGFIEPGKPKLALVGFGYYDHTKDEGRPAIPVPKIEDLSLETIAAKGIFDNAIESNHGLFTAIQLIRMGHQELGEALLKKSLQSDAGHSYSPFYIKEGQPADVMLAESCLAAAVNDILVPKPDFKDIRRRVEILVTDCPAIKSETTDYLLASLKTTIERPIPKPGSIDAVIQAYLRSGVIKHVYDDRERFNAAEAALLERSYEAIPALIELLDDEGMTNFYSYPFNNTPGFPVSTKMVVERFLNRLVNDELGGKWLYREETDAEKKKAAREWWEKAKDLGPEGFAKRYLSDDEDR